ncbi:hypothetical protein ACUIJN_22735 [Metabacillus halosaccharovorans]|uniref:hypothetical protein n=1 Tax=Metabacillus halosaccharovorans TaxID=930124 RepID=UPI00403DBF42
MTEGRLYFLTKPDPNRPIDHNYVTEIEGKRKYFINKEDALLFLFDNGIQNYNYLTKEASEYKDLKKVPMYKFWKIQKRVGYVLYDFEPYVDANNEVKKRRAFVWRFVGFGLGCFAETEEELKEKVQTLINHYQEDPENRGYNKYPFYTRYFR